MRCVNVWSIDDSGVQRGEKTERNSYAMGYAMGKVFFSKTAQCCTCLLFSSLNFPLLTGIEGKKRCMVT